MMTHTHKHIFQKNKDMYVCIYIYTWLYIRMNPDVSYKHHVFAMKPIMSTYFFQLFGTTCLDSWTQIQVVSGAMLVDC